MAAAPRFAELNDGEIANLLDEKDSENTKMATKGSKVVNNTHILYLKVIKILFCPVYLVHVFRF